MNSCKNKRCDCDDGNDSDVNVSVVKNKKQACLKKYSAKKIAKVLNIELTLAELIKHHIMEFNGDDIYSGTGLPMFDDNYYLPYIQIVSLDDINKHGNNGAYYWNKVQTNEMTEWAIYRLRTVILAYIKML